MILIAVANGALREAWLVPRLGDHAARQVSTLLLIVFFAAYIAIVTRTWPIVSGGEAMAVGLTWADERAVDPRSPDRSRTRQ